MPEETIVKYLKMSQIQPWTRVEPATCHFPPHKPSVAPHCLLDKVQAAQPGIPEAASLPGTCLSRLLSLTPSYAFPAPAKLDLHLVPSPPRGRSHLFNSASLASHSPFWLSTSHSQTQLRLRCFQEDLPRALSPQAVAASCEICCGFLLPALLPYLFLSVLLTYLITPPQPLFSRFIGGLSVPIFWHQGHATLSCHSPFYLKVLSSLLNCHFFETRSQAIPLSVFPGTHHKVKADAISGDKPGCS